MKGRHYDIWWPLQIYTQCIGDWRRGEQKCWSILPISLASEQRHIDYLYNFHLCWMGPVRMCKPIQTGHQSATISSVICKSFTEVFSVVVHIRLTKTWKTFCLHSWRCDRESQTVIQTRKTWINEQSLPWGPGWYPLPPRLGAKAFSCRPRNQWCFWDGFIQQARIIHIYIYMYIYIYIVHKSSPATWILSVEDAFLSSFLPKQLLQMLAGALGVQALRIAGVIKHIRLCASQCQGALVESQDSRFLYHPLYL